MDRLARNPVGQTPDLTGQTINKGASRAAVVAAQKLHAELVQTRFNELSDSLQGLPKGVQAYFRGELMEREKASETVNLEVDDALFPVRIPSKLPNYAARAFKQLVPFSDDVIIALRNHSIMREYYLPYALGITPAFQLLEDIVNEAPRHRHGALTPHTLAQEVLNARARLEAGDSRISRWCWGVTGGTDPRKQVGIITNPKEIVAQAESFPKPMYQRNPHSVALSMGIALSLLEENRNLPETNDQIRASIPRLRKQFLGAQRRMVESKGSKAVFLIEFNDPTGHRQSYELNSRQARAVIVSGLALFDPFPHEYEHRLNPTSQRPSDMFFAILKDCFLSAKLREPH